MRGRRFEVEWREDAATLYERYRQEPDPHRRSRLHALWILRKGLRLGEVAATVGFHYATLQQWVRWYRQGGLDEVLRHPVGGGTGRAPKVGRDALDALKQEAEQGIVKSARRVQAWLRERHGADYTLAGTYTLLRRLDWHPKQPRPLAAKASLAEQERWKKGGSPQPSRKRGPAGAR